MAVMVFLALFALGWPRGAIAWALAVGATLGAVALLKLVFYACHGLAVASRVHSPSGHTAAATVVYGGLSLLLWPVAWPGRWLVAPLVLVVVGLTRVALGLHTLPDVVVGGAVGLCGVLVLRRLAGPRPAGLKRSLVVAAAALPLTLVHGRHLRAEDALRMSALLDLWPLSACRR